MLLSGILPKNYLIISTRDSVDILEHMNIMSVLEVQF